MQQHSIQSMLTSIKHGKFNQRSNELDLFGYCYAQECTQARAYLLLMQQLQRHDGATCPSDKNDMR